MSSIKLVRSETTRSFCFCDFGADFSGELVWTSCRNCAIEIGPYWTINANAVSNATKCCYLYWFMIHLNFTQVWVPSAPAGGKVRMPWPLRRFWKNIPRHQWKHAVSHCRQVTFCELQNMGRYVMQTSFGSLAWRSCWLETGILTSFKEISETPLADSVVKNGKRWHCFLTRWPRWCFLAFYKCWLVEESWRNLW